jgi:NAD(P)-dependent dehydrogenase (short-subunit alcohol dehydrogenase family)
MLAKELGYWMKETGGLGRIIQFSAQGAENTSHSAYGLAKAAQEKSDDFLAYHLAPEVTVNSIQPVSIDQDPDHETAESYDAPLGRKVHSRELAEMAKVLCYSVFDTVTGEVIRMDSGRHTVPAYPKEL